jgi:polyhydroxybutyrate depolymerase
MATAAAAGLIPFLGAACLLLSLLPLPPAPAGASVSAATVPARPSAGCTAGTPVAPGTASLLLVAGGDDGAYVREVPSSYTGHKPMPVIIDLHGLGEPATLQVTISGLGSYGQHHGFITITPQVVGSEPLWDTTLGSKDLAFIGGLIQTIDSTLCADRNRIFVTGYSNGAFLTSSIACQFAGEVAAVAPVAGIENPPGCHPSRPVPVVAFHGTADQFVDYTGGPGPAGLKLVTGNGSLGTAMGDAIPEPGSPSIPANTAAWARRNDCASKSHQRRVTRDVTLIAYTCPHNATVELYRISGGGHSWPGSVGSKAIASVIGKVTYTISANAIMWRFFQAHPLRP